MIGTRGSTLAVWQAEHVREALLASRGGLTVEIKIIRTKGDVALESPLYRMLDKGLFTTEIQNALLDGSIDVAVHSLKDLPTDEVEGLSLAAVPRREDPADVLVTKGALALEELPQGARVLTSSLRRRAQILAIRSDLEVLPVRGNVDTRLEKFSRSDARSIVFAAAGLIRLGLADRITQRLEPIVFLPACGQGALGIEIKSENTFAAEVVKVLDDFPSRAATTAERAFLAALGGGCQAPVGAYGRFVADEELCLTGMAASLDGSKIRSMEISAVLDSSDAPRALGERLALALLEGGCREILDEARAGAERQLGESR